MENSPTSKKDYGGGKTRAVFSSVPADDMLVEAVLRPDLHRTFLCVYRPSSEIRYEKYVDWSGTRLVPYSARNNLLRLGVVKLPSRVEEFGSEAKLLSEIQCYIHRYVQVSPAFERIASYYVLLTWIYDSFNELPYLRLRGDPGSGKTRFLLTIGSLCYKPIFASGASSVSPLFRILDAVGGTLVIDEGDFRMSDERAEVIKILNNGNAKGFPVLRSDLTPKGEYSPNAYQVFGPKLVATRGFFTDQALESRCITEEMGQSKLRRDVPINLPATHQAEALMLRNKLLLFRFRNYGKKPVRQELVDREIEPRLAQVFVPLLSVMEDSKTVDEIKDLARQYNRELQVERGMGTEAEVLEVIRDLRASQPRVTIRDIAGLFADRYGDDYERKVTAKWIGWVIRKRLRLRTQKSHGVFVIANSEGDKLDRLLDRYGLAGENGESTPSGEAPENLPRVDNGDLGDFRSDNTAQTTKQESA